MNVLSLFDGMSCGQIALDRAGINVDNYYAFEIDKYTIKVTMENFPNTIQMGDVSNIGNCGIDWSSIDLIIGGSPCQGFSLAGKQLAFNDPRSKLFFIYSDILTYLKMVNPTIKFLLENVRMKKEYLGIISEHLGAQSVCINSALVSAQNRTRHYWCNWLIKQPIDEGILLKDILETDGVGIIKSHGEFKRRDNKSQCLDANYHKGADNHGQRTLVMQKPRGKNNGGLKALDGKTPCLTANSWEQNNKLVFIGGLEKGRRLDDGKNLSRNFREGARIYSTEGKGACLSSNSKGGEGGFTGLYGTSKENYRKLTPIECERLQTVPDNYTNHVSNSQRYKMLGNGWTVDVIAHIFRSMYHER